MKNKKTTSKKDANKTTSKNDANKKGVKKGHDEKGRFVKGYVPNPKGRPKKEKSITNWLRVIGEEEIDTKDGTMTKYEALARIIWSQALRKEKDARAFIADRIEGRPKQTIDFEGDEIEINVSIKK